MFYAFAGSGDPRPGLEDDWGLPTPCFPGSMLEQSGQEGLSDPSRTRGRSPAILFILHNDTVFRTLQKLTREQFLKVGRKFGQILAATTTPNPPRDVASAWTSGPLLQGPSPPRGKVKSSSHKLRERSAPKGPPALSPGLCIFVSLEVMRQSVRRMIDSEDTVWIEYYYSWSFACACTAFILLFLGGLALLLFSLPPMPQNPWESCMDAQPEH